MNPPSQAVPSQHVRNEPPVRSPGLVIGSVAEQVQCKEGDSSWSFDRAKDLGPSVASRSRPGESTGSAFDQPLVRDPPGRAVPRQGGLAHRRSGSNARRPAGTPIPVSTSPGDPGGPGSIRPSQTSRRYVSFRRARSITSHRPHAPEPPMPSKTRASSEPSPVRSVVEIWMLLDPVLGVVSLDEARAPVRRRVVPDARARSPARRREKSEPGSAHATSTIDSVVGEAEPLAGHVRTFRDQFLRRELGGLEVCGERRRHLPRLGLGARSRAPGRVTARATGRGSRPATTTSGSAAPAARPPHAPTTRSHGDDPVSNSAWIRWYRRTGGRSGSPRRMPRVSDPSARERRPTRR